MKNVSSFASLKIESVLFFFFFLFSFLFFFFFTRIFPHVPADSKSENRGKMKRGKSSKVSGSGIPHPLITITTSLEHNETGF